MKLAILGAGGVGCYYGAKLLEAGCEISFVARGAHLTALQTKVLCVTHPSFSFSKKVKACDTEQLWKDDASLYDGIIVLTKSMETLGLAKALKLWATKNNGVLPFCISLQNGVENESILAEHIGAKKVIGGLTRKIGAHIIEPGCVDAVGPAETILGAWSSDANALLFTERFATLLNTAGIPSRVTPYIQKELWMKLVINNGVNALCALLRVKTGIVMQHPKLFPLVQGLMHETAQAARALHVKISTQDVEEMFALIKGFDSIKPSMLVDLEHDRRLEIEEICGVVIRTLKSKGLDAPYTKTIASLLEYTLEEKL